MFAARAAVFEPTLLQTPRSTVTEQAAVRSLSSTFAKAVRELVGADHQRPFAQTGPVWVHAASVDPLPARATAAPAAVCRTLVREALLALPPPALGV